MSKLNLRRFFTLLLTLVMIAAVGTTTAFADDFEPYSIPIEEAIKMLETEYTGAPYIYFVSNMETYNKAMELSEKIVGNENDPYNQAKLIFQWMSKNCEYDRTRVVSSRADRAPYYEQGHIYNSNYTGICGDFAKFFAELCWTQNIPCVMIEGIYFMADGTRGLHAWNAFYANGKWHWVDATGSAMSNFDINQSTFNSKYEIQAIEGTSVQSDWAQPWVFKAMQNGLLDINFIDEISDTYGVNTWAKNPGYTLRESCSRLQFAQLAVNLLEVYYDKNIDEILADKGVAINEAMFSDTTDKDVLAANALGIVGGYGNGIYNPNGEIKRQEAAAILYRTAKVMGLEAEGADLSVFTDLGSIGTWAREAVAFCKATGIMAGTSATTFSAQGTYTREQCVVTIVRLFDAVN